MKRFSAGDTDGLREQILALRTGDPGKLLDVMVRFGWLREDAPVDPQRVAELAELALTEPKARSCRCSVATA